MLNQQELEAKRTRGKESSSGNDDPHNIIIITPVSQEPETQRSTPLNEHTVLPGMNGPLLHNHASLHSPLPFHHELHAYPMGNFVSGSASLPKHHALLPVGNFMHSNPLVKNLAVPHHLPPDPLVNTFFVDQQMLLNSLLNNIKVEFDEASPKESSPDSVSRLSSNENKPSNGTTSDLTDSASDTVMMSSLHPLDSLQRRLDHDQNNHNLRYNNRIALHSVYPLQIPPFLSPSKQLNPFHGQFPSRPMPAPLVVSAPSGIPGVAPNPSSLISFPSQDLLL